MSDNVVPQKSQLEKAISVALGAHWGQVDLIGAPYILHPLRVMLAMKDETAQIVAVLHDVIEDSSKTLDSLSGLGFSEEIVDAVDALTRWFGKESYEDYIERVSRNKIARMVKLADLADNLDPSRSIQNPIDKDKARTEKYLKAAERLKRE